MLRFLDTQRVGGKACQRIPFILVNIEDAQEVGQRQKLLKAFSDLQQFDIATLGTRSYEAGDHLSQPTGIDMGYAEEVQKYQRLLFVK